MTEEELKAAVQEVMYWASRAAKGGPSDSQSPAGQAWTKVSRWLHPDWEDEDDEEDD